MNRHLPSRTATVTLLLVMLVLGLPAIALAAPAAGDGPTVGDMLGSVLDPMFEGAKDLFGTYKELGLKFLSLALILECLWLLYDYFIRGGWTQLFSSLFSLFLVFIVPFAMFSTWPHLPVVFMDFLTSGLAGVLDISGFGGAGSSGGGSAGSTLSTAFDGLIDSVFNVLEAAHPPDDTSWAGEIGWAFAWVISIIVLMIPVMILGFAMVVALYGPMLMLHVGIILAPITLPWMVWRPMRELGLKWFSYMIHMGFSFLIGIILVSIAISALQGYAEVVASATAAEGTGALALLAGLIPMLIMLLFVGWALLRIETIAGALVGGVSVGVGTGIASAGVRKGGQTKGLGTGKLTGGNKKPSTPKPPPRPPQVKPPAGAPIGLPHIK